MKFLVLAATLSVSVAQGFYGLVGHPNGAVTPIDEPAVAAARAEHLATKFGGVAAPLAAAPVAYAAAPVAYAAAPVIAAAPAYSYAAGYGYGGPLNLNSQLVAHPNGAVVPVDEPAVAARRAEHFVAQGASFAAASPVGGVYAVAAPVAAGYGLAPYGGLVAHPNGAVVPVDEPAVAAARADHLTALGAFH